jgi:hypothetical protein
MLPVTEQLLQTSTRRILHSWSLSPSSFQSCRRRNFHRIYSRLQSNQICSLILSNKDDTPNQFQFIFSQWNIKELSHFRAITFIVIENDLLFKSYLPK